MQIDDKLREILLVSHSRMNPDNITMGVPPETIAQIKQAFADEYELIPRNKNEANND